MRRRLAFIGLRGFPGVQGGVETHCMELVPRLAREFDCRVFRRRPYASDAISRYPSIRFTDLPSTTISGFEAFFHTFLCCLRLMVSRCDAVNIHNIGPGFFAPLLRLSGKKVVLTYHSPNYEHSKWSLPARLCLRLCEKVALSASHRIIFVNRAMLRRFPQQIQAKSVWIPNGFTIAGGSDESVLDRFGLQEGGFILAVGRLTPEKGFDLLVRAAGLMKPGCRVVIAGGEPSGSNHLRRLRDLDETGRVTFTGSLDHAQLNALYSRASLFVLPSRNEGLPIVLLEAMGHGLDVMASDIAANRLPQLDDDDFFTPGDYKALAQSLELKLEKAPRRRCYDMTSYDWDLIAERTAALYRELLDMKP